MCIDCTKIAHGAAGIVKAAAGIDRPAEGVVEARREVCRACPEALPCPIRKDRKCVCRACGCLLRAKTALGGESCPLGKWGAVSHEAAG